MSTHCDTESHLEVNVRTRHVEPLNAWRRLYLRMLEHLAPRSIVEFGCGRADFLSRLPSDIRRVGFDGNPGYAAEYEAAGIEFHSFDFDASEPPVVLEGFDVAVCSDVFEHLLYPHRLLGTIAQTLANDGVLLSHVPNEFRLGRMLAIMRGRAGSVIFHPDTDEWTNPHLRRFTDLGYQRFLGLEFQWNTSLAPLQAPKAARRLMRLGLPVPFCLQGGPTYASTNSREALERLEELGARMARG